MSINENPDYQNITEGITEVSLISGSSNWTIVKRNNRKTL